MAGARPVSGHPQPRLNQPGASPWAAIAYRIPAVISLSMLLCKLYHA